MPDVPPYRPGPPKYDLDLRQHGRGESTALRSNTQIAYAHLLQGEHAWHVAQCLSKVLGLPIDRSPIDVFDLSLDQIDAAIVAEEARQAQREAEHRAPRAARTASCVADLAEQRALRKAHVKDVLPLRRAAGEKVSAALRELDTEGLFAAQVDAIGHEVEAGLRDIDSDILAAEIRLEAARADEAQPLPVERWDVLKMCQDRRGWLPDCMQLLRAVREDLQREHAAKVAKIRADLQLAGVI